MEKNFLILQKSKVFISTKYIKSINHLSINFGKVDKKRRNLK